MYVSLILTLCLSPVHVGFYFACSTHQIAVSVINKKSCDTEEGQKFVYYLIDGFYGAFMWISSYEVTPTPIVIKVQCVQCVQMLHSLESNY